MNHNYQKPLNSARNFSYKPRSKTNKIKNAFRKNKTKFAVHGSVAILKGLLTYATHRQSDDLIRELEKFAIDSGHTLTGLALKNQAFDSNSHRLAQIQIAQNTVNIIRLLDIIKKQAYDIAEMKNSLNQLSQQVSQRDLFQNINRMPTYPDGTELQERDFHSFLYKKNFSKAELIKLFNLNPITAFLYVEKYDLLIKLLNGEEILNQGVTQRFNQISNKLKKQLVYALKTFGRNSIEYQQLLRNFQQFNPNLQQNENEVNEFEENDNEFNDNAISLSNQMIAEPEHENVRFEGGKKTSSKKQPKSSIKKSTVKNSSVKKSSVKKSTKSSTKSSSKSSNKSLTKSSTKSSTKSLSKKTPTKSSSKKKPTKSSTKKQVKK